MAMSAAVAMATASAPNAKALAKSEETRRPPVMIKVISFLFFSAFRAVSRANIVGTDVAALINFGAAPVAPALPSIVMKSGFA